ncbi:aldehyde dehydrogenase family protein [Pseudomonas sp. p50]|uniref:aldehyde dehydrogenase family protein n=1 Tax=Pseudomonas sp. p50(2008) TaxID=2816832 RepID=UPI00188A446F|nr:aldehyde dehydrogenase family protein [Pseudomonas sp. p50(2008)]MBF4559679.1 aldehyde dehydrogenase family protein [Pseudomonas sp. p50(2008)]MBH2033923.1 aldehyde dehydrogenase family protein [Pseudomonadales bacterium]MBH2079804.1 aldehyde dehydrogenase family protein [Pseudomonadales bacterium]
MSLALERLVAGTPIPFAGNRVSVVSPELAARFQPGDHLLVEQVSGELLLIPVSDQQAAAVAIERAEAAFKAMSNVSDQAISEFFDRFAQRLESQETWALIEAANLADIERARSRGRSTTRLLANEPMRRDMIAGLRAWRDASATRGKVISCVEHDGWKVEQVVSPLGIVAFVFEGRPNVFADAAGVLRTGNTAVLRIGSDALGTAQAIVTHALNPALADAGLPAGAVSLVESVNHAAGWAMFADRRLSLAVARGSGRAVSQLGSIAQQSGTAVSLHGTGGAWLIADKDADARRFASVVRNSLDRKVCNTLNVCLIHRDRAAELVPLFLDALQQAGAARGQGCKLHIVEGSELCLPADWQTASVEVYRAQGYRTESLAEPLPEAQLGREWEWEETPEVSLKIVDDLDQSIALFNRYSPQFTVSLISEDAAAQARFYNAVNAPFVGNGITRWVDGQYALNKPELGLSNWESGRLFARSAILSGDGVFTIRSRMTQTDLSVKR